MTVALVVLLVGASVGVTLVVRGHRAGPAAKTVVLTSTVTSTSMTTMMTTSVATRTTVSSRTVTPPVQPSRTLGSGTPIPTPAGAQVVCRNGVKAVKGSCSTYQCWNNTLVTEQACPALTGQSALTWVFRPAAGAPKPTCAPYTDTTRIATGELEVFKCGWTDLPQVAVYLSRWNSVASALAYLGGNYGPGTAWTSKLDGKDQRQGVSWNLTPTGKNQKVNAELYDRQPYTLLALIADPDGAGKGQWDTYFKRQGLEYASRLDIVVASTT